MSFNRFSGTKTYVADQDLVNAVNIAIALKKPLVIRGEPGTGKTQLAHAIATGIQLNLIAWHIKSTTKAQDGLYLYDTVQRLNDSRFGDGDVREIANYIKLGPVGRAFKADEQTVLLIDEVDKADIEFPNDLLHELDDMSFLVAETGEIVRAKHRPIIIITSNNEKELPDAFLRRCVFHYIRFPDHELMKEIVRVHLPNLNEQLLNQCLKQFYWLRDEVDLRKKPSTSELIDWINALILGGLETREIAQKMPFLGTLVKKESDLEGLSSAKSPRSGRFS
jgi:MoxR-like ATPase